MNLFAQNCVHCCRSATFSENERHFQGAGRGGKNAHEKKRINENESDAISQVDGLFLEPSHISSCCALLPISGFFRN